MDEPDFGNDFVEQPEPLTPQEKRILEDLQSDVKKALDAFEKWMERAEKEMLHRNIKFKVSLSGGALSKFMYMKHVLLDGYGFISKQEFVQNMVEAGISTLYDAFVNSRISSAMQAMVVQELPPEIRDAIMTSASRAILKQIAEKGNADLADLFESLKAEHAPPQHMAAYQKKTKQQPGNTPPQQEPQDTVFICKRCGKPGADSEYQGEWFHADCLIDHGLEQQSKS